MISVSIRFCLVAALCVMALCVVATEASARRLHIAPGSYGVLVNGTVTTRVFQRAYTLNARAGQVLILSFTGNGPMRGSIACQGGGDGPYYGGGDSFTVPASGLCTINVGANTMAEDWTGGFTMSLLVSNQTVP